MELYKKLSSELMFYLVFQIIRLKSIGDNKSMDNLQFQTKHLKKYKNQTGQLSLISLHDE